MTEFEATGKAKLRLRKKNNICTHPNPEGQKNNLSIENSIAAPVVEQQGDVSQVSHQTQQS